MEWNISPFKDKNVPEIVATPGLKWSTGEPKLNSDAFRSRLHSSPYIDNEYIPRSRKGNHEKFTIPRLCMEDDQVEASTSQFDKESDADSGASSGLQQTRFYDNISASRYSQDSGILSSSRLSKLDSQNFHSQQSMALETEDTNQQNDAKYSFDPLAPPFKPRNSNVLQLSDITFDRASVKAIDVANYVNSRYRDEFPPKDPKLVLGDVTNLPDITRSPSKKVKILPTRKLQSFDSERSNSTVSSLPDATLPSLSQISNLEPLIENQNENMKARKRTYLDIAVNNPITASIKNSPIAKRLDLSIRNNTPTLEENIQPNIQRTEKTMPLQASFKMQKLQDNIWREDLTSETTPWPVERKPLFESSERNREMNMQEQETKKVTFADIVQAGIRAINKSKKENPELYNALKLQQTISTDSDVGPIGSYSTNENYQGIPSIIMQNMDVLDPDASQLHRPSKYRTEPCTTFHTIGVCPYGSKCNFYHTDCEKNDAPVVSNAMRYKTRLCKTWQKAGECPYGTKCDFAHGTDDLASNSPYKPHYKTRMCKVLQQTGRCPYGAQCTFAHKQCELRTDISLIYKYKTEICKSWALGMECSHGTDCHFAHGERELKNESDLF